MITSSRDRIREIANTFTGGLNITEDLFNNHPSFLTWSGGCYPRFHHYGSGGLLAHTCEVIEFGVAAINLLDRERAYLVDKPTYFYAALFHDVGKIYDYTFDE
jgi:hypothetical protein